MTRREKTGYADQAFPVLSRKALAAILEDISRM
jgi:hypothetical protein